MPEPLTCPRCSGLLTNGEVVTLHRQYANSQRKTRSGGKNGGRRSGNRIMTSEDEAAMGREILRNIRGAVAQPSPTEGTQPAVRDAQDRRVLVPTEDL